MFVKTRAVFNAGAGGVWVVGSHPQNILHLRRTSFIKLKVLYKPTAPPEQIHRPDGPPCLPKKTIPASFPLVPSGRYVCKRNQTPSFPPSCRDGMLVTKHKANPWFAPPGQYALPSQEIMLRKGLGCLPKQHTAPNGAGFCLSGFLYKHTAPRSQERRVAKGCTQTCCSAGATPVPAGRHVYQKKPSQTLFPSSHRDDMLVKRNQTPSFPASCRDGMLVTKLIANPWFAAPGQYALSSRELMLRKGLGCLPKQHTAPNGAGFCLSGFLYKHTAPTAHKLHQAQGFSQTYCSAGAAPVPAGRHEIGRAPCRQRLPTSHLDETLVKRNTPTAFTP